jgi:phage N-6-adenine-methyltransferase
MARSILGTIDVDPASNDYAQSTVRAATFYTAETNGLDKEWRGRVWMNPPYSRELIGQFIDKLIEEYKASKTTEAIVLTHNSTDTRWAAVLFENASAMCFTRGRVKFESPSKRIAAPAMGQLFTYLGSRPFAFASVFSEVGHVVVPANDYVRPASAKAA